MRVVSAKKTLWMALAALGLLWLAGCGQGTPTPDEFEIDSVHTQAAQTVIADLTLSAGETAVALLTELARPTTTDFPFLLTRLPTSTPAPPPATPAPPEPGGPPIEPTPPPEPTGTPVRCDLAALQGESPAGEITLPPGSRFRKSWRLVNQGGCAWNTDYLLLFSSGDWMGDQVIVPMPSVVLPGESVELTAQLTAPQVNGLYRSVWWLQNFAGEPFGIGPQGDAPLEVVVRVAQLVPQSRFPLDFARALCTALWESSEGGIDCAGAGFQDGASLTASGPLGSGGSVGLHEFPRLETRREDEPALQIQFGAGRGSWVRGQYPPFNVSRGQRLIMEFGCAEANFGCEAALRIEYRLANGLVRTLGVWEEVYDNRTTRIDIDLSALAGQWVEFIFTLDNESPEGDTTAILFVPRVEQSEPASSLLFTWRRETRRACDEIQIFLLGDLSAEALAYNCGENQDSPLGRASLSGADLQTLLDLRSRLNALDFRLPAGSEGERALRMQFFGQGIAEAARSDLAWLDELGERLFAQVRR